jgi:hypothetical protein
MSENQNQNQRVLTLEERFKLYAKGWRDGVACYGKQGDDDLDYQKGYREGRTAYLGAMQIARRVYEQ